MLPDRVSNPGPLTYESGALPIAPRGPAGTNIGIFNERLSLFRGLLKYRLVCFACKSSEL